MSEFAQLVRQEIELIGRLRAKRDSPQAPRINRRCGLVMVSSDRLYVIGERGEYRRLRHITPAMLEELNRRSREDG